MNRCPLCLADTGDPLLGTDSGALLCSACSGLAPMDRLQLIAKVVVSTPPHESNLHRMGRLARWLASDGMKVVHHAAKLDEVSTRAFSQTLEACLKRQAALRRALADLEQLFRGQIARAIREAILEEREACARLSEEDTAEHPRMFSADSHKEALFIARRIRGRPAP